MSYRVGFLLLTAFLLIPLSCTFRPCSPGMFGPPTMGSLTGYREASDLSPYEPVSYLPADQSGALWEYDGEGTLYIHHLNAAFRCESEVHGRVVVDGNTIVVKEVDEGYGDEFCLYNLDYMITGLKPGKYYVWFEEPMVVEGDDPLSFTVDLRRERAWDYATAYRINYPWSPDDTPWGKRCTLCGPFPEVVTPDHIAEQVCIAFWYIDGILKLRHAGERIGCGSWVEVDITVDGPVITVEEYARGISTCLVVTHADTKMEIYNLPPAHYRLVVHSFKRNAPPVELEIDLKNNPDGFFCYFP